MHGCRASPSKHNLYGRPGPNSKAPVTMNALIARAQHRHAAMLAREQPSRSLLVQPLSADPERQKTTPWVALGDVRPNHELWTRSVLLNEVLFDVDTRPWSRVAAITGQLQAGLDALNVPRWCELTGGKGTHTSVFLDPASITGPASVLDDARRLGVDVWSVARLAVAEALLDAAGFAAGDEYRWAPPIGNGPFDRLKVKWSAFRAGSMVRVTGCRGGAGFRKTVPLFPFWEGMATLDAPPELPLRFPRALVRWAAPKALNDRIFANVEASCDRAEAAQAAEANAPPANPIEARKRLMACACVRRVLTQPTPKGTRHYAFLNAFVTMKALGLPRSFAEARLREVLALNALPDTDPVWGTLADVYEGRYAMPRLTCPSPHVSSWCNPNGCPWSKRLEFVG